jgi:hypothetical protein
VIWRLGTLRRRGDGRLSHLEDNRISVDAIVLDADAIVAAGGNRKGDDQGARCGANGGVRGVGEGSGPNRTPLCSGGCGALGASYISHLSRRSSCLRTVSLTRSTVKSSTVLPSGNRLPLYRVRSP